MERGQLTGAAILTAWGWAAALSSPRGLVALHWPLASEREALALLQQQHPTVIIAPDAFRSLAEQLCSYFHGEPPNSWPPVDPTIGTAFQRQVWEAVQAIPYGEIRTYRAIAETVGRPKAARAVGQALRANPVPLVIPCHRVVGTNGALCGYGGPAGIALKEQLLRLERGEPARATHGNDAGLVTMGPRPTRDHRAVWPSSIQTRTTTRLIEGNHGPSVRRERKESRSDRAHTDPARPFPHLRRGEAGR